MKKPLVLLALLLIIVFTGSIVLGSIVTHNNMSKNHHTDCVGGGVDCGPIEHLVFHHFTISDSEIYPTPIPEPTVGYVIDIDFPLYSFREIILPPPQQNLV